MSINTATISGFVSLPNDTSPDTGSFIEFTLSGFDTDDGTVIPETLSVRFNDDGTFITELWPNASGVRGTRYDVAVFVGSPLPSQKFDLGSIIVPDEGEYDLDDLLAIEPPEDAGVDEYIVQLASSVTEAETAASVATSAAAEAANSADIASTASSVSSGEALASAEAAAASAAEAVSSATTAVVSANTATLAAVAAGAPLFASLGEGEVGTVDGDVFMVQMSSATAVYQNSTGSGTFLSWLGEFHFDDVSELLSSTLTSYPESQILRTRKEGFSYEVAAIGASDHDITAAGGVKLYILPSAEGSVSDKQWGNIADDADRVQAAVDWSIKYQNQNNKVIKIVVSGLYTMNHPIGIFDFDGVDTYSFCSAHIEAPAGGYVGNQRTTFQFTNPAWPGFVLHQTRNVILKNISIIGPANDLGLPSTEELLQRDRSATPWWRTNAAGNDSGAADIGVGGRTYGLCSGIVWDAFKNTQSSVDKYGYYDGSTLGVANHYTVAGNAGSTKTQIDNCEVQGWIIGAQTSGSSIQLGDSITIRECNFSYNRVHYMVGESQNRGIVAVDCHGKGCDAIMASGSGYGAGTGSGGNVRGGVYVYNYALVNVENSRGSGSFADVYTESTWTVGHIEGNFGFTFRDCNIKLLGGEYLGSQSVDSHLTGGGDVAFEGGFLGQYVNEKTRVSNVCTKVSYRNVTFSDMPFYNPDSAPIFENCTTRNTNSRGAGGTHVGEISNLLGHSRYGLGDKYINSNGDIWAAQSRATLYYLGTPEITVNTSDGTATLTLTPVQAANIFEDDYLSVTSFTGEENDVARTPYTVREMGIGRVRSVSGTTVTLEGVPISLTTGIYTLKHRRMPKYTPPTFGDVTNGSNVITNMSAVTGWQAGDMISTPYYAGWLPLGTRVVSVDIGAKEITLSNNASGSSTNAYIADGVLSLLHSDSAGAPTSNQYMSGCFVKAQYNRTVDSNGKILDGWLCVVGGLSPVWEPVYLSTVSATS